MNTAVGPELTTGSKGRDVISPRRDDPLEGGFADLEAELVNLERFKLGCEKSPEKMGKYNERKEAFERQLKAQVEMEENIHGNGNRFLYLQGRFCKLNDDPKAESYLAKAVKLDPLNCEAWNTLGELFWGNGDLNSARDCFVTCLEQQESKSTLRHLSMLLRKLGSTPKERVDNTMESLKLCKRAIALDFNDGESWYTLGNTYLFLFFSMTHATEDLQAALKAYRKSQSLEKDDYRNPDLYFNRAQVLVYLEEYESAVEDYEQAKVLDPSLPADAKIDSIVRKIDNSTEMIKRNGRIKPKRLATLVKSLKTAASVELKVDYSRVRNINGNNRVSEPVKLERVQALKDLVQGDNPGVAIDLKIVLPLARNGEPPVSFLVTDRDGVMFVLSVYHLEASVITKIKSERDHIIIAEPSLRTVNFRQHSYQLVQLKMPTQFFVNGKILEKNFAHAALDSASV